MLENIVDKYNNAYNSTIKMKAIDVKSDSYAEYKLKTGDHIRISKYKNIFPKGYAPNSPEEVLVISKIKITVSWTYIIMNINGEQIIETFYKKELQKNLE